ncbi:MAG: hypothetical protein COB02_16075 [Candidatus Cloacimonadota bacterium]|nr:MAG: hypothetical protein COB02_16075 [Candidatus Cloacimonadota bacterium]
MKSIILKPYVLMLLFAFSQTALVPNHHAGMLSNAWDSIVGFFSGKKKGLAPEEEAQIKVILESTQNSQDGVIQAINDVDAMQSQLTDLKDLEVKKQLDAKMEAVIKAVEANNQSFEKMTQAQQFLQEKKVLEAYQSQFAPFYKKQETISKVLQKVQDKYSELSAFTQTPTQETQEANVDTTASWENKEVQSMIDEYIKANDLNEWGGPNVAGSIVSRPRLARGMDRYQYLMFALKGLKEKIEAKGLSTKEVPVTETTVSQVSSPSVNRVIVENLDETQTTEVKISAPAASENSFTKPVARVGMALTNRYDKIALRNQKDKIYREMMAMVSEGKMESEEYKELLQKYTKVSDQLKK